MLCLTLLLSDFHTDGSGFSPTLSRHQVLTHSYNIKNEEFLFSELSRVSSSPVGRAGAQVVGGVGAVLGVDVGAHGDRGVQTRLIIVEGGADRDTLRL